MRRFRDLALGDFLERVDALTTLVERVHEMHCDSFNVDFRLNLIGDVCLLEMISSEVEIEARNSKRFAERLGKAKTCSKL